jgi:hypothetical protein
MLKQYTSMPRGEHRRAELERTFLCAPRALHG